MGSFIKKIGTSPAYVKSFRWVRPGNAEAIVVQESVLKNDPEPTQPSLPIQMTLEGYREEFDDGIGTRYWTYRSGANIPDSPNDPNAGMGANEIWTCDIVASERPLTRHPSIQTIMDSYGGILRHGRLEFAPKTPGGDVNPFYGVETYFAPGVTMTLQKNDTGDVSASGVAGVGTIDDPSSRGTPFTLSGSGDWLLIEHSAKKWGGDRSESFTWRYSPDGWQPEIYDSSYW